MKDEQRWGSQDRLFLSSFFHSEPNIATYHDTLRPKLLAKALNPLTELATVDSHHVGDCNKLRSC